MVPYDLRSMPLTDLLWAVSSGQITDEPSLIVACGIIGEMDDSVIVRRTLVPLLSNADEMVRAAAVYVLGQHLDNATTNQLIALGIGDGSRAVRLAVEDVLDF